VWRKGRAALAKTALTGGIALCQSRMGLALFAGKGARLCPFEEAILRANIMGLIRLAAWMFCWALAWAFPVHAVVAAVSYPHLTLPAI